jgi:hypothetical protein
LKHLKGRVGCAFLISWLCVYQDIYRQGKGDGEAGTVVTVCQIGVLIILSSGTTVRTICSSSTANAVLARIWSKRNLQKRDHLGCEATS